MLFAKDSWAERWIGKDGAAIPKLMRGWYGGPLHVFGTPYLVTEDGYIKDRLRPYRLGKALLKGQMGGFASLSDLIAEATGGKQQNILFSKVGTTGVVGRSNTLFFVGNYPSAASSPAALPNGTNYTGASTGALPFTNPSGGDTAHLIGAQIAASVAGNTLLLADRLWSGAPVLNSTSDQTISMSQSRYSSGQESQGIFAAPEVITALASTAHNTRILYRDQDNNTAETSPYSTGVSGAAVNTLDFAAGQWFYTLNSEDSGIYQLTGFTISASLASGALSLCLAKALAVIPCGAAYYMTTWDGINTAFNMIEIKSNACLCLFELIKPSTTATTYNGMIVACSG